MDLESQVVEKPRFRSSGTAYTARSHQTEPKQRRLSLSSGEVSPSFFKERKADWGPPLWRLPISGSSKTADALQQCATLYGVGVGEAEAYAVFWEVGSLPRKPILAQGCRLIWNEKK